MVSRRIRHGLLFTVQCLVFLLVWEAVLRLFHFHQIVRYREDPGLPFVMVPGQVGYTEVGRYPVTINSLSMRGPEVARPKPPGTRRIVFLGDSVTYGDGVAEPETFVRRLEAALSTEGRRVEVLNAGVKGYNSRHELIFFRSRCLDLEPDLLLVGYCVNDQMPDGTAARPARGFSIKYRSTGILRIVKGSALYVGTYRLIRSIAGAVRGLPPHYMEFIRPGDRPAPGGEARGHGAGLNLRGRTGFDGVPDAPGELTPGRSYGILNHSLGDVCVRDRVPLKTARLESGFFGFFRIPPGSAT